MPPAIVTPSAKPVVARRMSAVMRRVQVMASAIAAGLAQKMTLRDAVARARDYVRRAIETAPGFGRGHGPLNHAVTVR